jgi:hypothetical protein
MKLVSVNENYQTDYTYPLTEALGEGFSPIFRPDLTPKEMLDMGIFGGNYFSEAPSEFPASWFAKVVFSTDNRAHASLNYFKVNASQPLSVWQRNDWIYPEDPKGWFLWYCRYYLGRRIAEEDDRQIKRWAMMRRHITQLQNHCRVGDLQCRPRQRQALLHWAYDSKKF